MLLIFLFLQLAFSYVFLIPFSSFLFIRSSSSYSLFILSLPNSVVLIFFIFVYFVLSFCSFHSSSSFVLPFAFHVRFFFLPFLIFFSPLLPFLITRSKATNKSIMIYDIWYYHFFEYISHKREKYDNSLKWIYD